MGLGPFTSRRCSATRRPRRGGGPGVRAWRGRRRPRSSRRSSPAAGGGCFRLPPRRRVSTWSALAKCRLSSARAGAAIGKSRRCHTDATTMAPATRGERANSGVSHNSVASTTTAHTRQLTCVRAPAASLTLERVKLPAAAGPFPTWTGGNYDIEAIPARRRAGAACARTESRPVTTLRALGRTGAGSPSGRRRQRREQGCDCDPHGRFLAP